MQKLGQFVPRECKHVSLFDVIARLAASANASAGLTARAPSKPWRRRDRAIQHAGTPVLGPEASGILDAPHSRGMTAEKT